MKPIPLRDPYMPIVRPRARRRLRRDMRAILPVLLQGALMAMCGVVFLWSCARFMAAGMQ